MSPFRPSIFSRPLVLAVSAGLALTLAACGGSKPDSPASERATERSNEVKLADYARCLREHGINAQISSAGGEVHGVGIEVNGTSNGGGRVAMEAAQNACKKYQPAPRKVKLSPQQKVEQEEGVRKFAACMRSHGIDIHAAASEGHVQIQIHGGPGSGGPNPESPSFQKAQETCGKYMHGPNGGKFKAPPSSPGGSTQEGSPGAAAPSSLSVGG